MQTSFPNLPFTNYSDAALRPDGDHSSTGTGALAHPRTDLENLKPWTSFPNDIHDAIQSATAQVNIDSTPFNIPYVPKTRFVESEDSLRSHVVSALHDPVETVLSMLGVNGQFITPGRGNVAIVGDPDYSWIAEPNQHRAHPKLVVEYKPWWVADLVNAVAAFNKTAHRPIDQRSFEALQQIYGYMTFNETRYGILTNWQRALFLRRAETASRKTLDYYVVELGPGTQSVSMLKAWVGMVLLANNDWFYASPTVAPFPSARHSGTTETAWGERLTAYNNAAKYCMKPIDGQYQSISIDFRLCRFNLASTRRGAQGCIVMNAQLLSPSFSKPDTPIICKVLDITRYPNFQNLLVGEATAYARLRNLQGKVIPKLYGFYEIWGILQFLALEPVGEAIPEDLIIDQNLRMQMRAALQHIHDAGYIHGDVARRNFCRRKRGKVYLVDLEHCRLSANASDQTNEMNQVNSL